MFHYVGASEHIECVAKGEALRVSEHWHNTSQANKAAKIGHRDIYRHYSLRTSSNERLGKHSLPAANVQNVTAPNVANVSHHIGNLVLYIPLIKDCVGEIIVCDLVIVFEVTRENWIALVQFGDQYRNAINKLGVPIAMRTMRSACDVDGVTAVWTI